MGRKSQVPALSGHELLASAAGKCVMMTSLFN
jgi:hypothetical protein